MQAYYPNFQNSGFPYLVRLRQVGGENDSKNPEDYLDFPQQDGERVGGFELVSDDFVVPVTEPEPEQPDLNGFTTAIRFNATQPVRNTIAASNYALADDLANALRTGNIPEAIELWGMAIDTIPAVTTTLEEVVEGSTTRADVMINAAVEFNIPLAFDENYKLVSTTP